MKNLQKGKSMKKGIFTILLFAALMCSFVFSKETVSAADSDIVYIPDQNFKALLNERIGVTNPNANITKGQLENLAQIVVETDISDFTGIEHCTNLRSFIIYGDKPVDLSKLKSVETLESITIEVECINDMKDITSCANLEVLQITGYASDIKVNFSTIGNLKKLEDLRISGIKSSNYSRLMNLTSLENVEIHVSDMTVLPDFSANENLISIDLTDCSGLKDISSLNKMTNLERLRLLRCKAITNFAPLKGMTNLEFLDVEKIKITEENQADYMSAISTLTNLEEIHASYCDYTDAHTSMFDNLTKLETLVIGYNDITNPEFLLKHKNTLTELMLTGNPIPNNNVLKQMKKLQILGLEDTYITDFTFIPQLPDMTDDSIRFGEWEHDMRTWTESEVQLALPDDVTSYVIKNDVIDDKGNYVAPEKSDWYSYDENTHLITIYPKKMEFYEYISYGFTMTTCRGTTLYAGHSKMIHLDTYRKPSIVSQPEKIVTFLKDDLTIDMNVQGNGKIEYLWYKNGGLVSKGTTPDLVIKNVDASDAGTYQLIMKDEFNSVTSKNITVTVKPYTKLSGTTIINGNTVGVNSIVGNTITLSISATGGSGSNKYSVVMKDVATGQSTTLLSNSSTNTYSGKLTSTGTKQFIVTIKDSEGNTVQTNVVTAYVYEKLAGAFTITGVTEKLACEVGDTLTLTGSATGGSGSYMYQMSVVNVDTGVSTTLKGYSSSNTYSVRLTSKGTYKFVVMVKDSIGNVSKTNQTITVYDKVSAKISVNGSTSALQVIQGNKITLQANASGGSGTYTYQFKAYDEATNKWYTLQDYGKSTTYTYKLSYTGNKKFIVIVKDSVGNRITSNYLSVSVKAPLSGKLTVGGSTAALTVNKGTSITLTATGYGGMGGYTYKFAAYDEASGKWYILKDFSASAGYTYTCNYGGKKQFAVTVKDSAGNTVATNRIYVTVSDNFSGKLTVNGSTNAITKSKGSTITLNATASGGTGNYTYKFAVYNEDYGTWSILKDFSTTSTYTFALNYPGKKQFAVTVKDSTGKTVATNRITVTVKN